MSGEARRAVQDARALLAEVVASGASSLHVAVGDVEVFVTRRKELSPMLARAAPPVEPQPDARAEHAVTAPHVATVDWIATAGARVEVGQALARLRVLDAVEDLVCEVPGAVVRAEVVVGALIEYGQLLLTLVRE